MRLHKGALLYHEPNWLTPSTNQGTGFKAVNSEHLSESPSLDETELSGCRRMTSMQILVFVRYIFSFPLYDPL